MILGRSRAGASAKLHKEELLREAAIKKNLGISNDDVTVETVNNAKGLLKRVCSNILSALCSVVVLALAFIGALSFVYLRSELLNAYYANMGGFSLIAIAVISLYFLYAGKLILRERRNRLKRAVVDKNESEGVIRIEKNTAVVKTTDILGMTISLLMMIPVCIAAYLGILSLLCLTPNLLVILDDCINQIISAF